MLEILLSDANYWFSVALFIVVILFSLELTFLLFGISILGLLDDSPVANIEMEGSSLLAIGNWLNIDKVPLLVWLVCFLSLFGLLGFIVNAATHSFLQFTLPSWISIIFSAVFSLFATSKLSIGLAKLLPKIQSSALDNDDFVGAVAHITIGRASRGNPAEAKFTDNYAQPHYVLVEPFEEKELFDRGERVILVKKTPHSWLATRYQ